MHKARVIFSFQFSSLISSFGKLLIKKKPSLTQTIVPKLPKVCNLSLS